MQKTIKKKAMAIDVDAFVADILRPSAIPEADEKAKKRVKEKTKTCIQTLFFPLVSTIAPTSIFARGS